MWLSRYSSLSSGSAVSGWERRSVARAQPAAGPCRRRLTPGSAPPSLAGDRRCGDAVPPARRQPPAGPGPGTSASPGRVLGRTGARRQPAAPSVTPALDERDERHLCHPVRA